MGDFDEYEISKNSRTDKTYVSREISSGNGQGIRIANKYIDAESGFCFAKIKEEIVL